MLAIDHQLLKGTIGKNSIALTLLVREKYRISVSVVGIYIDIKSKKNCTYRKVEEHKYFNVVCFLNRSTSMIPKLDNSLITKLTTFERKNCKPSVNSNHLNNLVTSSLNILGCWSILHYYLIFRGLFIDINPLCFLSYLMWEFEFLE